MNSFSVNPIQKEFHDPLKFCEQLAVLYYVGVENQSIKMIRSFVNVGRAAVCSFNEKDSAAGWDFIDNLIEKENVRGIFHTHPSGVGDFSGQDVRSQKAMAVAYGRRMIWHGMQPIGSNKSRFICMHRLNGQVIRYDFGEIYDDLNDPVLYLPLPVVVTKKEDHILTIDQQASE